MAENFKRKIENFICGNCGCKVEGNGYTNHCPECFWSKHVDNSPGDREAGCEGMMKPVAAENESGEYTLTHKCQACGHEKRNKMAPGDNFEAVIGLF